MNTHQILAYIRNPYSLDDEVRAARLAAADLIEQQEKQIESLSALLAGFNELAMKKELRAQKKAAKMK